MAMVATVAAMVSDLAISRAATGDSLTSTTIAMVQGQEVQVALALVVLVLVWAVPAARAVMEAVAVAATGCHQVKESIMVGHTIAIRTLQPTNMVGSLVQGKHT